MKLPKMILFDYGQTLIAEQKFDGLKGTEAVLEYAVSNPHGYTAADIQAEAVAINNALGRGDFQKRHLFQIEIPNYMFTGYLYQSMGIQINLTAAQIDQVFWDAASPGVPTKGITDFLSFLDNMQIRTGVISNISYNGDVVRERIHRLLPHNSFEFILPSSEYIFRKPNSRIFTLALEKAELNPEDVWYIGDNYQCDVVGSRQAGLFPVWYIGAMEANYHAEDVLTISHWNDLMEIMRQ